MKCLKIRRLLGLGILCLLSMLAVACKQPDVVAQIDQSNAVTDALQLTTQEPTEYISADPSEPATVVQDTHQLIANLYIADDCEIEQPPARMDIFQNSLIEIDDATAQSMIDNLSNCGWEQHTFSEHEPGLYFVGCNKQSDDISLGKNGDDYSVEESREIAQSFLTDSGLYSFLDALDISYEMVVQGEYAAMCYLMKKRLPHGQLYPYEF